jgi:hypothetical protein
MSETNFTLTKEYLHQVFEYKNGGLYWKINKQSICVGSKAGTIDYLRPYVRITLHGKRYQEHHLVFLMFNGVLPKQIDHINGIKNDNRIENLRHCTNSQNQYNTKPKNLRKNVSFYKRTGKWQVQLKINQKTLHFGYFEDVELADLVAHEARDLYHGKFARHN